MASIISRKRKDGTLAHRADIRIKRNGLLVYQESRTFDRKAMAKDWSQRREVELQDPAVLNRAMHKGMPLKDLIQKYAKDFGAGFGRSKRMHLDFMQTYDLADKDALELQPSDLVTHILQRRESVKPSTALQDLVWLKVIFKTGRSAWGMPLDVSVIEDAMDTCKRERLIARPQKRDRRPTLEELKLIMDYADQGAYRRTVPIGEVILFALFSARRQDEITRLRWVQLDERNKAGIVPDMKDPRGSKGNHHRVYFTDEAWAIIQRQPKTAPEIFPYNAKSISVRFIDYCKFLGIKDLRFHDLRHECVSWLFELGWDIPRVAGVSGHKTWSTLQRYTHLSQQERYDKYQGWKWRPTLQHDLSAK